MAKKVLAPTKVKEVKVSEIALTDMTVEELTKKAAELSEKISRTKLEIAAAKTKNVRLAFILKDQLSRTLTVLNIKKMR